MVRVRWLEGYEFQQNVPHDVDFRILLTFLELYRTLLSFVMYKLYTEENLVYPPPLDSEMDEKGESVGAFKLVERKDDIAGEAGPSKVSKKEVKRAIKGISHGANGHHEEDDDMGSTQVPENGQVEDEFVERPTKDENEDIVKESLTTYSSILASTGEASSSKPLLFAPYTFYVSRETSSKAWEFVIRAMGGKIITSLHASFPDQSPQADSITHVIVDRPMETERMRQVAGGRKWTWIQPQWVADCVNRGKIIGADEYAPGKLLPPHLSPWEGEGELSRPWLDEHGEQVATTVEGQAAADAEEPEDEEADSDQDEEDDVEEMDEELESASKKELPPALLAAAANPSDETLRHAAELEAERLGTSHGAFDTQLKQAIKSSPASGQSQVKKGDEDLRKIMMSMKKAKLYEKIKYSNRQKADEVSQLLNVPHCLMN